MMFSAMIGSAAGQSAVASISAVPVDPDTQMITYTDVVHEPGTKNDFFNRAVAWINKTYKNPSDVTSVRDPQTGKIEGNHRFKIYTDTVDGTKMEWGTIIYSFKLEFKDGRYKYTFDQFLLNAPSKYPLERWLDKKDPSYSSTCVAKLEKVNETMNELINGLKEGMKPPKVKKEEDW
jgi:hypothetical protein